MPIKMCHNKAQCSKNTKNGLIFEFSSPKYYSRTKVGDDCFRPIQALIDSFVYVFYWQSSAFDSLEVWKTKKEFSIQIAF